MFKAIGKTVGIAIGLVAIPLLLLVAGVALTVVGPLAGAILIVFLPLVIVGVIIGYKSAKKDKGE